MKAEEYNLHWAWGEGKYHIGSKCGEGQSSGSKEAAGHGLHSQGGGGLESLPGLGMHSMCF